MVGSKRVKVVEAKTIDYSETKATRTESSITFKVCEVVEEIFKTSDNESFKFEEFIKKEIQSKQNKQYLYDYSVPYEERNKLKKEYEIKAKKESEDFKVLKSSYSGENTEDIDIGSNSFVHSAWNAYSNHHHLVIRPDNIWLAIMTQFSLYINANSNELKSKLVDHDGKKELIVETEYRILEAPFDKLVVEMADQIQSAISDSSIRSWVIPSFTTTTPSDKVVFSSVLMSTMQKYFEYSMRTKCGLPQVTLHGEIADWVDLKDRVARLSEFDNKKKEINKWLGLLMPVIDKFIESVNGSPDTEWWNKIVDHRSGSGRDDISGWITAFCVFNNDGKYQANLKTIIDFETVKLVYPRIETSSIPNGFVSTPVTLIDLDKTRYESTLFSGHLSVKVENTKLSPSLDWLMVVKKNK